jgi:hypothetical protein
VEISSDHALLESDPDPWVKHSRRSGARERQKYAGIQLAIVEANARDWAGEKVSGWRNRPHASHDVNQ